MQPTAGRSDASLYFMKTPPLQFKHVDSFTPTQSPLPLRLDRLPRGFPAPGVLASAPARERFRSG